MSIKRAATSSVTKSGSAISDVPDAPTGLSATDSGDGTTASVSFTAAVTGGTPTSYTVTSSPGGFTGTGASSPISVTGLTAGTAYTFTATATNSSGTSSASSASSSLTLASVGSYFLIERSTVGAGGASSVTFSNIPQTYTHLQLRAIGRVTGAVVDENIALRFNSDSSTNYSNHNLAGDYTTSRVNTDPNSSSTYGIRAPGASSSSNMFGSGVVDILDYKNTTKYKTVRALSGHDQNSTSTATSYVMLASGNWRSTSAITSITLISGTGNIAQYSSFALYGIKGA